MYYGDRFMCNTNLVTWNQKNQETSLSYAVKISFYQVNKPYLVKDSTRTFHFFIRQIL